MHSDTIIQGLENLHSILCTEAVICLDPEEQFQFIMELMNFSTSELYQDDDHRIWDQLVRIIEDSHYQNDVVWVRLYRGVLVLIRNVIIFESSSDGDTLAQFILTSFIRFITNISSENAFYARTNTIYFQILANVQAPILSKSFIVLFNHDLLAQLAFEPDYIQPLMQFLHNSFHSKDDKISSDGTYHNEQIYELLQIKLESNHLMGLLQSHFDQDISPLISSHNHHEPIQFSRFQADFINLLTEILTHESFGNWIFTDSSISNQHIDSFSQWLKISQLLITSKDNWNNYELISIISWILKMFDKFSQDCIDSFSQGIHHETYNNTHELILIISLDILSDLGKFNQVTKMLIHFNILDQLIPLFRAIHDNIKPITIKTRERFEDLDDNEITFPQVKSLIIEIISYLTFENYEVQEKVRHLHGLELVLSNCIIDDNNPFIKERAIICLKYLLFQNPGNQKFVTDLEAKGTNEVNEEIIDKAGYEVEIVDGKVHLKQKP